MATNYPTGLDNPVNPAAGDYEDTAGVLHSTQHANANDAIKALEAKVGINSSALNTTLDYKISHHLTDSDPHAQYQKEIEKGAASGYASLDGSVLVPLAQIPSLPETRITGLVSDLSSKADLTWATSQLALKADDTAVVKLTGNQTVAGIKTFSSAPVVPSNSFAEAAVTNLVSDLSTLTTNVGLRELSANKSVANGYAGLDSNTLITAAQSRGRVLAEAHATTSFDTSTAENTLASLSIPGGSLAAGDLVRILMYGDYLANSGSPTYTWKLKFGTTTVLTSPAIAHTANAARRWWAIDANLHVESTSAQRISGRLHVSNVNTVSWELADSTKSIVGYGTAAESTGTSKSVILTVQMNVSNLADDIRLHSASLILMKV